MALSVEIEKRFAGFSLEVAFEAGDEKLGLLGESGCGKTLTMRCVAGIETPDAGRIVVNDRVFFDRARGAKAKVNLTVQERKTALLFQNYMLFPNLTVAQNVSAGIGKEVSKEERARQVEMELNRFGISKFADRYPAQLSGGQQQRVALARMIAAKPGILMLDEPFSALDSHLKGVLEQNLTGVFGMFEGTIVYISHDIDEALRFCDRIAVMDDGRIMEISSGEELVNSPKSTASIKLSGCKNVTKARRVSDHRVFLPRWGVEMTTEQKVPENVLNLGIRAFMLERVVGPDGVPMPGYARQSLKRNGLDETEPSGSAEDGVVPEMRLENVFRMRCDRVSDSRFERTILLGFVDDSQEEPEETDDPENEMSFLHNHVFWRVDKLQVPAEDLPELGQEVWIRFPPDCIYLVDR